MQEQEKRRDVEKGTVSAQGDWGGGSQWGIDPAVLPAEDSSFVLSLPPPVVGRLCFSLQLVSQPFSSFG
jgi:hypothetical protein